MNSITLHVTDEIIEKMKSFYQDFIIKSNNQYVLFTAKTANCVITAYTTNKVLFQGKNAEEEASIWMALTDSNFYLTSIGSDEVGTGDYFGPVVVVSCYLSDEKKELLQKLHIRDSKELSDNVIQKIAPILFKELPYSLLVVNNEKYNELTIDERMNLNQLKAKLHKQAIQHLLKKINTKPPIIVDEFTSKENFAKYTNDPLFTSQLIFTMKAESKYASVACASIMARYKFLLELANLSNKLGITLHKGTNDIVEEQAIQLVKKYGSDILRKVAKVHFKTTNSILKKANSVY